MRLIFRYVRPYLKRMTLGLIIKFLGTIMDLFLPYILAHIIDNVVPLQDLSLVLRWGVIMLVCCRSRPMRGILTHARVWRAQN